MCRCSAWLYKEIASVAVASYTCDFHSFMGALKFLSVNDFVVLIAIQSSVQPDAKK